MNDKYLSVITNFGCHYSCPYCIVKNNHLNIPKTTIHKIYGIIFIVLGALTIPIEWDATFFLFALMVGILLFASRENCIMD